MIELKNVSFQYENGMESNGLSNVSLCINRGEVVLLCGESGCGKTTLTRLINGLIPHYFSGRLMGEIKINDKDVSELHLHEIAKYVGSVFQNPRSQFYCMDTNSELAFACENQGIEADDIFERINTTANYLNIGNLMNRNIFDLSGGEKQKIACGCVHTVSPDIIVLDEPSSNLDADSTKKLGQIISHWKKEGKTIVIAEHRLYYLRDIADRMIYMVDNKVKKEFSLEEAKKLTQEELSNMGLRTLFLENLKSEARYSDKIFEKIELHDFYYSYNGKNKALNVKSLDFPKGEIIGVIGHNGAGKSTFARCLCGLNKKFKGSVRIGERLCINKERIGKAYMVMQDVNHQLFTETVLDEVLLSMDKENERKARYILESLNLLSMEEMHPMALSGGQKQRVAIAGAIASEREIIIFDEPTSGLDLKHMIQVSENIKQLKKIGKTPVVITHDLELLLRTCDYLLYLKEGEVYKSHYFKDSNIDWMKEFFS